jgi:hypothetical protein
VMGQTLSEVIEPPTKAINTSKILVGKPWEEKDTYNIKVYQIGYKTYLMWGRGIDSFGLWRGTLFA